MTDILASALVTHLDSLTATNAICVSLGTTLTAGTNLYLGEETTASNCIIVTPYGGAPPNLDNYRQESALQIMVKSTTRKRSLETCQAVINYLHTNDKIAGKFFADQSSPILLGAREGGKSIISVANFIIRHVKL